MTTVRCRFAGVIVALFCGVLLLPAVARADAEKLLQESMIRYRLGEFRPALKLLRKARRKARKTPAMLARVYLQMGVVHSVLRKKKRARKAFRKALRLDPTLTLEAGDVKKNVLALFSRVRAELKGPLKVTADRPGAMVSLDGKQLGPAPYNGKVVIGNHEVVVTTPDALYQHRAKVVIKEREHTEVEAKLAFVGGRLNVISLPSGAAVMLDGKPAGTTPIKGLALTAGVHEITVKLKGRKLYRQKLNIKPGDTPSLAATLDPDVVDQPVVAVTPPPATQPAPDPVPPPEVEQPTRGRFPLWTVVTGGAALAMVGLGVGMGLASSSAFDEYETTQDQQRYFELEDNIKTYDTVMAVSYAAAGALAITSVCIYLFVERKGPAEKQAAVVPLLGPGMAGVRVTF